MAHHNYWEDNGVYRVFTDKINGNEIISTLKNGMEKFLELSTRPLIYFLNSWGQSTVNKMSLNNTLMRNDLKELRDGLSNEIINLQRSFNYDLQNDLKDLDFYVDDKLEDLDKEKENIEVLVHNTREDYIKQLELLFKEKINVIYDQLLNKINKLADKLLNFNQKFSNQIENQQNVFSKLNNLTEGYRSVDNYIQSNLNTVQEDILTEFSKKVRGMTGNLNRISKDTKSYLSDLKAAIILLGSSKVSIKSKLTTIQAENKDLQKTVKELRSKNQDLLNKIKKFEKGGV